MIEHKPVNHSSCEHTYGHPAPPIQAGMGGMPPLCPPPLPPLLLLQLPEFLSKQKQPLCEGTANKTQQECLNSLISCTGKPPMQWNTTSFTVFTLELFQCFHFQGNGWAYFHGISYQLVS